MAIYHINLMESLKKSCKVCSFMMKMFHENGGVTFASNPSIAEKCMCRGVEVVDFEV